MWNNRIEAKHKYQSKQELNGANRGKLRETLAKSWLLSIIPKIPKFLVGIQNQKARSVSISSDRNIRDHLWRWTTYFGWNIATKIRRS